MQDLMSTITVQTWIAMNSFFRVLNVQRGFRDVVHRRVKQLLVDVRLLKGCSRSLFGASISAHVEKAENLLLGIGKNNGQAGLNPPL